MTAIAAFVTSGVPVLIPDLTVFTTARQPHFKRPGSGRNDKIDSSGYQPLGLRQKILRLAPGLALAFAGDIHSIERFVAELRRPGIAAGNPESPEECRPVLDAAMSAAEDAVKQIQFVGFCGDELVQHDATEVKTTGFTRLVVGGSGAATIGGHASGFTYTFDKTTSKNTVAVSKALMLMGQFWAHECHTEYNYAGNRSFGGGFQAYAFQDGDWRRLNDVMLTFAVVKGDEIGLAATIAKHDYVGMRLMLRVAHAVESDNGPAFEWRNYAAARLGDKPISVAEAKERALELPDLNASATGTGIVIDHGSHYCVDALSITSPERDGPLHITQAGDEYIVNFTPEYISTVNDVRREHRCAHTHRV